MDGAVEQALRVSVSANDLRARRSWGDRSGRMPHSLPCGTGIAATATDR